MCVYIYIHINTYMDTWYLNWCSAPLADCNGLLSTIPPKGISWWKHIVLSIDETWCCCETLIHRPTWSSGIDQEYWHYQPWTLPVLENDAHWAFPRGMVALIKNEECNVARIQPRGLQGLSFFSGVKGRPLNHWSKWGWLKTYCSNNANPLGLNFGKMNPFHAFDSSTRVVLVHLYGMNMARKSACGFHCVGIVITIWYECCIPCPQYQRYRNSIKIIARPYQIHIGKPSWNTYI